MCVSSLFRRLAVGVGLWLIGLSPLSAAEPCDIASPQDILDCALDKHPDVVTARDTKNRDETLVRVAGQRPNPELESLIQAGKNVDDTVLNTETALLHTFELGGKRKARIVQAERVGARSTASLRETREATALQTVLALYRLRQIRAERACAAEAGAAFEAMLRAFRTRPQLTPEQEVAKAAFELSREEYRLKETSLEQEHAALSHLLELATEVPYDELGKHLPPFKNDWPPIADDPRLATSSTAALAKARAERQLAGANLGLARAKAWPDLQIGPAVETESLTTNTRVVGGLAFTLPLPLLNLNRGEKAYAAADQVRADTALELTLRRTAVDWSIQQNRYEAAVRALQKTRPASGHAGQHEKLESFFEKGLVPSSLIIETHRQLYDITRTRNEQELTAIDALWRLYILDGSVFEQRI